MKIEHVALYTKDLEKTRAFFEDYFNATSGELYHNKTTNFRSYFLSFEDGSRLEIMNRPEVEDSSSGNFCTGYAHLAFSTGSKEKVDELTKRLSEDGYEVISGPRTTGDGYYESCILGPENNQLEITV